MIDSEILENLEYGGFPLKKTSYLPLTRNSFCIGEEQYYVPTIPELILACKDKYDGTFYISIYEKECAVKSSNGPDSLTARGETLDVALANFWLLK